MMLYGFSGVKKCRRSFIMTMHEDIKGRIAQMNFSADTDVQSSQIIIQAQILKRKAGCDQWLLWWCDKKDFSIRIKDILPHIVFISFKNKKKDSLLSQEAAGAFRGKVRGICVVMM